VLVAHQAILPLSGWLLIGGTFSAVIFRKRGEGGGEGGGGNSGDVWSVIVLIHRAIVRPLGPRR
jgi:hypothetical protein